MSDGIAHLDLGRCLDTGDDVTHIACGHHIARHHIHTENANFIGIILLTGVEELNLVALTDASVLNLEICYYSTE